jgi:hypothetical protein
VSFELISDLAVLEPQYSKGWTTTKIALMLVEGPLCGRMRGFDRLDDFEPLEFRVAEYERLALARPRSK